MVSRQISIDDDKLECVRGKVIEPIISSQQIRGSKDNYLVLSQGAIETLCETWER